MCTMMFLANLICLHLSVLILSNVLCFLTDCNNFLIRVAMIRAVLFTFLQLDYALGYLIEYSAGTGRETTHSVHLQQK